MAQTQPAGYSAEAWEAIADSMPDSGASRHPIMATLYAEHRYMATLLALLAEQLDALEADSAVDSHVLFEAVHYMIHFPDSYHHPREDLVYQRAGELDPGIADSVDTLQRDHDFLSHAGANVLRDVEGWRDGDTSAEQLIAGGREYIGTLYRHMSTEEKLVFPQIEALLSESDWRELERDELLEPRSDPVFGPAVDREYRNLARKARRALRRGVEDVAVTEWIGLEVMFESLEVLSMAVDNSRSAAREHWQDALDETRELLDEASADSSKLLLLPLRCMLNNGGHYLSLLRDLGSITRDTTGDLSVLNKDFRGRLRQLWQADEVRKPTTAKGSDARTLH